MQPFYVLAAFLLLLFATGGSSWAHEGQLIMLRPIAVLVAAWGLARMQTKHWCDHRVIWAIFFAATFLTVTHLVPLPYEWWSRLPGRAIISDIDFAAGFGEIARPLSMQPEATMNALLSLAVPLAVLALGVQLDEGAHRRICGMLLILIAVSALIGLIQLSGSRLALYETVEEIRPSGVFNNRNHQVALLTMAIPLAILAWRGGYQSGASVKLERIAATGLAIFILPLAVVTGSRSGLLLLGVALICALASLHLRARPKRNRNATILKIAGALVVLCLSAWLTIWTGRAEAISRLFGEDVGIRLPLWKSILDSMPVYMPWGTGVGTYADAYQIHEPAELLRPTFSNHAHNEWLEIAFTAGVPGMLMIAVASIAFVFGAVRAIRCSGDAGVLPRSGAALILIMAIASTTDYPVRTPIMLGVLALAALWLSNDFPTTRPKQQEL